MGIEGKAPLILNHGQLHVLTRLCTLSSDAAWATEIVWTVYSHY